MKKKRVDLNDLNAPSNNQVRANYGNNPQSFNTPSPAPQVNPSYHNNNYPNQNVNPSPQPAPYNPNYDARHVAETDSKPKRKEKPVVVKDPEEVKKSRIKAVKLTYRIVLMLAVLFLIGYFIYALIKII